VYAMRMSSVLFATPARIDPAMSRRSPVVTASLVDPSALYSLSTSAADAGGSSMLALLAGSALVAGLLYHTYQVKAHRQTSLASVGGVASPFGSSFNSVRQEATRLPSAAVAGAMAAPSAAPAAPIELSPLEEQEEASGPAYQTRLAEIQASSLGDVKRRVVSIGEAYQSKVGELWSSYAKRQAVASPVIAESAGSPRAPVEETITLDVLPKVRGPSVAAPSWRQLCSAGWQTPCTSWGSASGALLDRLAALQAGLTHDAAGRELGFLQALKAALRQLLKGPPPSKGEQRQALGA
ncbi:hypothetical protein APUTEX25_000237, partial [Auxenochlorella protothecoides]